MLTERELILVALDRAADEAKRDPDAARRRMIAGGFATENGDLPPWYGGPGSEGWLEQNPDAYTIGPKVKEGNEL